MTRVPVAGLPDLGPLARRTSLLRLVLAAALAGLLAASVWAAAGRSAPASRLIQPGVHTVLVLDVSASIRPRVYRQVDDTLRRLIAGGGGTGLVVFSDIAYELLPVGTPVRELASVERFFRPLQRVPRGVRTVALGRARFLRAPWGPTLTQGTKISTGLEVALDELVREADGRGRVVLVSDLGDEIGDLTALGRQIDRYATRRVPLQVVALSPQPEDLRLFRSLLAGGRGSLLEAAPPGDATGRALEERLPAGVAIAAVGLLLALAVNEASCARLALRPRGDAS